METRLITNKHVQPGHVIVERTERGSVRGEFLVKDRTVNTACPGSVHLQVANRKTPGHTMMWCMNSESRSEIIWEGK